MFFSFSFMVRLKKRLPMGGGVTVHTLKNFSSFEFQYINSKFNDSQLSPDMYNCFVRSEVLAGSNGGGSYFRKGVGLCHNLSKNEYIWRISSRR